METNQLPQIRRKMNKIEKALLKWYSKASDINFWSHMEDYRLINYKHKHKHKPFNEILSSFKQSYWISYKKLILIKIICLVSW